MSRFGDTFNYKTIVMSKTIKALPARNIDEYIAGFPVDVQKKLEQVRIAIKKAIPKAEETIKYAIPTYTLNGNIVSFGAWKKHIGLYPAPRNVKEFAKELSNYDGNKSTVQFPLDKPIPKALISKMVKWRAKRMLEQKNAKKKKVLS